MDETNDAIQEHIHSKCKPLDEVRRIIRQSGFELNCVIHDSFKFRYADGTAMLESGMIRYWFYPSWRSLLPPDRADVLFEEVEIRLNDLAIAQGELSLSIPFVTIDAHCGSSYKISLRLIPPIRCGLLNSRLGFQKQPKNIS